MGFVVLISKSKDHNNQNSVSFRFHFGFFECVLHVFVCFSFYLSLTSEVEQGKISPENNTDCESEKPVPEIQVSQDTSSTSKLGPSSNSSQTSEHTESDQSALLESTISDAATTPFLSKKSSSHKDRYRKSSHFLPSDIFVNSSEKQKQNTVSSHLRASFSNLEYTQKSCASKSRASRLPTSVSPDSETAGFAVLPSYRHTQASHVSKKYDRSSVGAEADLGGEANQGTQYLLPETSGFLSFTYGTSPELKRGRGRPRKEGLNPLLHKAR